MFADDIKTWLDRLANDSLARAFTLSLIFHVGFVGIGELGFRLGWWKANPLSLLLLERRGQPDPRLVASEKRPESEKLEVIPIIFVDVDPAQASEESPAPTKYYSARNSRAANPDTKLDTAIPKINGTQDKVPKTAEATRVETPRPQAMPLQPAPRAQKKPDPQPQEPRPESKNEQKPGDLALAKPADPPVNLPRPSFSGNPQTPPNTRPRPRRLDEIKLAQSALEGAKMKQDGGVKRFSIAEGLDVKQTPFGAYDQAIIEAIQKRWFDLLEQRDFARNTSGKVVLTFRLNSDGRVTAMQMAENDVGDILGLICQAAVKDPAPFPPWPNDMRRLVGADYREVRFTFYYH